MIGIALKVVAVVSAALVIFSAYGHSSQSRGFSVQTATGYEVTDVKYWTNEAGFVEGVDFALDAPAHDVSALLFTDGIWLRCRRAGTVLEWTCPATGEPRHINDSDTLQVRAY